MSGGEDMEQLGEEKGGSSGGIARPLLMVVGGGCALSAVAIGVLLLLASSHMVIKAKCSPLEDPRIEQRIRDRDPSDGSLLPGGPASPDSPSCFAFDTDDRVNKTKKCDKAQPNLYRAVVRVEGPSHVPDTFTCCVCKWQEDLLTPATLQWLHTKQGGGQRFSTPRPSSTTRVSSSHVLSPGAAVSRALAGSVATHIIWRTIRVLTVPPRHGCKLTDRGLVRSGGRLGREYDTADAMGVRSLSV